MIETYTYCLHHYCRYCNELLGFDSGFYPSGMPSRKILRWKGDSGELEEVTEHECKKKL